MTELELLSGTKSVFDRTSVISNLLLTKSPVSETVFMKSTPKPKLSICPDKESEKSDIITKDELFKYYLAIDKQLLNEVRLKAKGLTGLGQTELDEIDAAIEAIIIDKESLVEEDIDELEGLGKIKFVEKVKNKIKNKITETKVYKSISQTKPFKIGEKATNAAIKVVKKGLKVVHKTTTFPARMIIKGTLKILNSKVSPLFLYAFIKDDDPILNQNPEVEKKSKRAKIFLNLLSKGAAIDYGYLLKHIRNGIVKKHGKSPEEVIIDLSKGKELEGLGQEPVTTAATLSTLLTAIAPVVAVVPAIVTAFKGNDAPKAGDWTTPATVTPAIPEEGGEEGFVKKATKFITSPTGIILSLLGLSLGTYGIYRATKKRKKK